MSSKDDVGKNVSVLGVDPFGGRGGRQRLQHQMGLGTPGPTAAPSGSIWAVCGRGVNVFWSKLAVFLCLFPAEGHWWQHLQVGEICFSHFHGPPGPNVHSGRGP